MFGRLIKFSLKLLIFGAIFWSLYSVLPTAWQASIDRVTDGPVYAIARGRYEIYKFALEFFGETHEQAKVDSEMYKPINKNAPDDQRSEAERDYERLAK